MLKEHKPVYDLAVNEHIMQCLSTLRQDELASEYWSESTHIEIFESWIQQSQHRLINGLSDFKHRALCSGTSQAIETFITRNQHRCIRFSKNEFILSKIVCNANGIPWRWLEDGPVQAGDAIIISCPFSGNGSYLTDFNSVISSCEKLEVPVLVDAAYFGISSEILIDVTSPCITDVCVSISKPFSTMLRHGIRFTRLYYDDPLQNASAMGIISRPCAIVSSKLLLKFDSDYIVNRYISKYQQVCSDRLLIKTPTITLALGDPDLHQDFKRGDFVRICVTDEILQ